MLTEGSRCLGSGGGGGGKASRRVDLRADRSGRPSRRFRSDRSGRPFHHAPGWPGRQGQLLSRIVFCRKTDGNVCNIFANFTSGRRLQRSGERGNYELLPIIFAMYGRAGAADGAITKRSRRTLAEDVCDQAPTPARPLTERRGLEPAAVSRLLPFRSSFAAPFSLLFRWQMSNSISLTLLCNEFWGLIGHYSCCFIRKALRHNYGRYAVQRNHFKRGKKLQVCG